MGQKQKVLVIVGPTASGKSALAVRLAKRYEGEIISADSRQVYKGLTIGTGKISKKEMAAVKHYLLDVVSAKKQFTASDFQIYGEKALTEIQRKGKLAIICGGTGFYIDALLGRIALSDVAPNLSLREKLAKKSAAQLFAILKKKNPKRAHDLNASDRNNPVRLIRAIEIAAQQSHNMTPMKKSNFDTLWLGFKPASHTLRARIHKRLIARMKRGMVQEARRLHATGLTWKRMEELGLEYRYLAHYLQKKISKGEMLSQLEVKIWHYAKRQMTYWGRNKDIQWFDPKESEEVTQKIKAWLLE